MNIRYDDETQTALDELDRNIENRHKYLSVNFSFNWQDFHQDPVLQELQRIKSNLIATATIKVIKISDYPSDEKSFFEQLSVSIKQAEKTTGGIGKDNPFTCRHEDLIDPELHERTPCHGKWRSDIEQFNIEESE